MKSYNCCTALEFRQNRIALLKKEEERAWRKIQQTKKRADDIVLMRRENEKRLEHKRLMALEVRATLATRLEARQ